MEQAQLLPHSTDEEAKAQKGQHTCSRSHRQKFTYLKIQASQSDLRIQVHIKRVSSILQAGSDTDTVVSLHAWCKDADGCVETVSNAWNRVGSG